MINNSQNGHLTDQDFWNHYWKKFKLEPISNQYFFSDLLSWFPQKSSQQNSSQIEFIEIGGFPGSFATYFNKNLDYSVTLLDFHSNESIIRDVEKLNQLKPFTLKVLHQDLFNSQVLQKYDVVFSAGFIEHFENTKLVIQKHVDMLKDDGYLFITLPNFNGLNGWIQKTFDTESYNVHNIKSMNLNFLKSIAHDLKLNEIEVFYHGQPCLWLDHPETINPFIRKLIYLTSLAISKLKIKNWFLSPQIVIRARK